MTTTQPCTINSFLVDLDGTLVDTAPDLVAALNAILVTENRSKTTLKRARHWAAGGSARLVKEGFGISTSDLRFPRLRQALLHHYTEHLCIETRLFPGMNELLQDVESKGWPWGIVTNKPAFLTHRLLYLLGLTERAATVICGDTLKHSKPHPAPVLKACEDIGSLASTTLFAGDDLRDIQAGRTAGSQTAAVTWGYAAPGDNPHTWQADHVIESVDGLRQVLSLD